MLICGKIRHGPTVQGKAQNANLCSLRCSHSWDQRMGVLLLWGHYEPLWAHTIARPGPGCSLSIVLLLARAWAVTSPSPLLSKPHESCHQTLWKQPWKSPVLPTSGKVHFPGTRWMRGVDRPYLALREGNREVLSLLCSLLSSLAHIPNILKLP